MHYLPDTSEADAAAESFWAENYKTLLREDFRQQMNTLLDGTSLKHVYARFYAPEFSSLDQFVAKLADMVTIGAENGTDDAFDDIFASFLTESPLPEVRCYARRLLPRAFSKSLQQKFCQTIADEYSQEKVYQHAYRVGYQNNFDDFNEFIYRVADIVVAGARMGADDMLGRIYQSFFTRCPLPPARRHPKRLKSW